MSKRIQVVPLALALLTVGGMATSSPAATPIAKPNLIFILFDDLGYGEPPSFRAESRFKTPHLDRLARESIRFTDARCAAAICIGKWHMGWRCTGDQVTDGPLNRGFGRFFGYTDARRISQVFENDRLLGTFKEIEAAPLMAQKTVACIDERAQAGLQPFFIYVPLTQPHIPHIPSPEFQGKSGQQGYGDWIMQGNAVVGQILDALDRRQLASNTLLLVSRDNGAQARVYAPLRDCQGSIWESGHRVPFCAYWPGRVKLGSVCDDTICLNDLMATCADVLGVKLPDLAAEDSVSVLPDLLRTATVHGAGSDRAPIRPGRPRDPARPTETRLSQLQGDHGTLQPRH